MDPDKYEAVPIGITKEGHWLVGAGAQKMLPEVLKGGQRVMMTADPSDAALVRLDGSGGGQRVDVVFPVMHGTFGEDGTIQGLLDLAGLPFVGAGVLGSAIGMDKDVAKRLLQVARIPVVPWITVQRADWERNPKEIQVSGVREAGDARFVRGNDESAFTRGARAGAESGSRIRDEDSGGALRSRAGNRGFRARQSRSEGVRAGRDRAAPRILRLRGEIFGRGHPTANSGKTENIPVEKNPEDCRGRVSRAGIERNGARGFFPGEKRRQNLSQRGEYDPGLHIHQHVSQALGSERNSLPRTD